MTPSPETPENNAANTPQSIEAQLGAQRRREAVERSRVERLLHAKADLEISESETCELTRLTSDHARFASEVKRTRLALDHMSILPAAPDFSARVLECCEPAVQFTTRPKRKTLVRNRLALAACAVLLVIGLVSTHRFWPGWNRSAARSEPLAKVLSAGQRDLASSFRSLSNSGKLLAGEVSVRLSTVPQSLQPKSTPRVLARDTKLKLGDTSRFDKPVTSKLDPVIMMASQSVGPGTHRRGIGNEGLIFADDQWLLASLAPHQILGSREPFMASATHAPRPLLLWNLPLNMENAHPENDSQAIWPSWPNIAD